MSDDLVVALLFDLLCRKETVAGRSPVVREVDARRVNPDGSIWTPKAHGNKVLELVVAVWRLAHVDHCRSGECAAQIGRVELRDAGLSIAAHKNDRNESLDIRERLREIRCLADLHREG